MNTLKIFTLLFIGSFAVNAQDLQKSQVPAEVVAAFEKAYPDANDVEWEKHREGFSVDFEQNRMDREIRYDDSWGIVRTETELMVKDLPAAITKTIKTDFAGYRIEDAEVQEKDSKTTYFVELDNGTLEKKVSFDASGKKLNEWAD